MNLSLTQQTLGSLSARAVQFTYCHDSRQMWSTAIRYTLKGDVPAIDPSISFLLIGGIGLSKGSLQLYCASPNAMFRPRNMASSGKRTT
jgi:hypothetical protein